MGKDAGKVRLTEAQLIGFLGRECKGAGGQKAWARLHNLSPQYVCDVLAKRRKPGKSILAALDVHPTVIYLGALSAGKDET